MKNFTQIYILTTVCYNLLNFLIYTPHLKKEDPFLRYEGIKTLIELIVYQKDLRKN